MLAVAAVASAAGGMDPRLGPVLRGSVDPLVQIVRGVFMGISAVVIVAGGSVALHRALKQAGVLEGFPD